MRKITFWAPPLLWAGLIFSLSSFSMEKAPSPGLPFADKIVHALLFAVLSFLLFRAFRGDGLCGVGPATVFSIVITALYGATDEWHQSFTPDRHPDLLDWAADCAGAALGSIAARFLPWFHGTWPTGSGNEDEHLLNS